MSKYVCGRCRKGFDELQVFGDHHCLGDNPILAALGGVINVGEFNIDLEKAVEESIEKHRVQAAVNELENGLRRGDLSA